ncbi:MAG: thiamine pyrophosphate-dependent dehydrogenase E1 component subunit alpha [Leptolinea sp.]|jgi:pyruvate dehydrogenase E1 component alpha subunit|nr:thiamine pyrophosphate-dependent dehydrogenase E1 component subunit alpha [Leptolinea sp.]
MPVHIKDVTNELQLDPKVRKQLIQRLSKDKLQKMLEQMFLTRFFEENAEALYMRGLVHGTMHLSIGMEASPIGSIAAIRDDDYILHHHRGHGHTIAKGADITLMMGEFIGKEPGYCRGRGGSMHIADIPGRNLGATGIVGGGLPTAVGIGLALQMKKSDNILLCFFGDGATNEGSFHEALNMAALWKLPIVFICDNNQYGMSMAAEKAMTIHHISERAASYNIPGVTVDGNDVFAVYNKVSEAVMRARSGEGPSLVENLTYRWRGHSKSDRNLYRTQEEIDEWKQFDPIIRYTGWLQEYKVLSEGEIDTIEQSAKDAIAKATETALAFPEPTPENLEAEVYAP